LEVEREPQGRREGWHRREERLCDVGCGWIWHKAKQGGAASNKEKRVSKKTVKVGVINYNKLNRSWEPGNEAEEEQAMFKTAPDKDQQREESPVENGSSRKGIRRRKRDEFFCLPYRFKCP